MLSETFRRFPIICTKDKTMIVNHDPLLVLLAIGEAIIGSLMALTHGLQSNYAFHFNNDDKFQRSYQLRPVRNHLVYLQRHFSTGTTFFIVSDRRSATFSMGCGVTAPTAHLRRRKWQGWR